MLSFFVKRFCCCCCCCFSHLSVTASFSVPSPSHHTRVHMFCNFIARNLMQQTVFYVFRDILCACVRMRCVSSVCIGHCWCSVCVCVVCVVVILPVDGVLGMWPSTVASGTLRVECWIGNNRICCFHSCKIIPHCCKCQTEMEICKYIFCWINCASVMLNILMLRV